MDWVGTRREKKSEGKGSGRADEGIGKRWITVKISHFIP